MRRTAFLTAFFVALSVAAPAFAQINIPSPAPAPLIGLIGLPIAALVLGAVWLVRRRG
jgi:hypothetical protein